MGEEVDNTDVQLPIGLLLLSNLQPRHHRWGKKKNEFAFIHRSRSQRAVGLVLGRDRKDFPHFKTEVRRSRGGAAEEQRRSRRGAGEEEQGRSRGGGAELEVSDGASGDPAGGNLLFSSSGDESWDNIQRWRRWRRSEGVCVWGVGWVSRSVFPLEGLQRRFNINTFPLTSAGMQRSAVPSHSNAPPTVNHNTARRSLVLGVDHQAAANHQAGHLSEPRPATDNG